MSVAAELPEGWTLAEALEWTADPELWKAWTAAKKAWEQGRVPTPPIPSAFPHKSTQDIQTLRKAADAAFDQLKDGLWQHLTDERLAAIGSQESGSELPIPIHSAGWRKLIVKNWAKSVVQERGSKTEIYNIRIFPILHSEDAPARIAGRSMSDVFRKFVIEDPEVASLGKRVTREEKLHVPVFRDGQYPGYVIDFKWPLDLTARDLAFHFVKPPVSFASDPLPRASNTIEDASRIIVDRWQALRSLLIDGKLIARGTFVATGMVGMIDPLQWTRAGLWIDVRNGDLLESENYKPVLRWSGLALMAPGASIARSVAGSEYFGGVGPHAELPTAPSPTFHVKPTVHDGMLPATTEQQRASVKSAKAIARVDTSEASYKACLAWLVEIMRASPDERTESRQSLWKKAQKQWPGSLSERSFIAARAEAIRISGAKAWGAAGASRKSPRESPR